MAEVYAQIAKVKQAGPSREDPKEFGRKIWFLMRQLYVANPADADKITWSVDHLANESTLNVMKYYNEYLLPSMQSINLADADFSKVQVPVLAVHGTRDRQAPYGGGREWAMRWPNCRLVTIENAAHLPWIEAPETVLGS